MAESSIEVTEGSGKKVSSQSVIISSQTVYIERAMEGMGILTLPAAQLSQENSVGLYPSASYIDCQGRYYIILKTTYNDNVAYAIIRLVFYDSNDALIGYSELIPINNIAISDGSGRYLGEIINYSNTLGAKSFKIYISYLSSGDNITMYCGVI